jgi:hypothetical protein
MISISQLESHILMKNKTHNQRLVYAPYGRSDSRRDAAPAAQAWRYVH